MNRLLTWAFAAAVIACPQAGHAAQPSWIFQPSTFTHDPTTGARVAQYAPIAPVEPLPDPRLVTSGYRRIRTNLRGPDGSIDSSYQVTNFANGRGGLDAEWERVADEWRASFLSGSFFQQGPGFGGPGFGGPGFGTPGFGVPGFGFPGFGAPGFFPPGGAFAPGFAYPGFGYPGYFPFPPRYYHPWHDLQNGAPVPGAGVAPGGP